MPGERARKDSLSATPDTNDRILDAATELLANSGVPNVTVAAVARTIGTSIRPVHNRMSTRSQLLIAAWRQRLLPELGALLQGVVAGGPARRTALQAAHRRTPTRDAAIDLVLTARFHADVDAEVQQTLGAQITRWTQPSAGLSPESAARNAFLLCLALGLLIGARHARAETLDLPTSLPTWLAAANHPGKPRPLPARSATHIDDYPVLAPGDPALDILLNTALELISRRGFDQVSVAQIARAAGFTEGLVFSRYATKLDMVIDATQRQNEAGLALNNTFTTALYDDFGPAIAEAVLLREAQLPGREVGRSMALEQIRLGWRHASLAKAQDDALDEFRAGLLQQPGWADYESETDFFLQMALSWGAYLLPFFNPDVHALPYDVVLTHLYASFAARR